MPARLALMANVVVVVLAVIEVVPVQPVALLEEVQVVLVVGILQKGQFMLGMEKQDKHTDCVVEMEEMEFIVMGDIFIPAVAQAV
jgi:hypothetical protein